MDRDASGRHGVATFRGLAASAGEHLERSVADLIADVDAVEYQLRPILADDRVASRLARQFRRATRDPHAQRPPHNGFPQEVIPRPGVLDPAETVGRPEVLKDVPIPQNAQELADLYARMSELETPEWRSAPFDGALAHTPPAEVQRSIDSALRALNERDRHALVTSILALGDLLVIRPFPRDNKRLGRLIARAIAYRGGYTFAAYAPWRETVERSEVEESLRAALDQGDPTPWVRLMLQATLAASRHILEQARYVGRFVDELNERQWRVGQWFRTQSGASPERTWRFREVQGAFPWIAPRTLKRDLARLRELGILSMEGRLKSARYRYTAEAERESAADEEGAFAASAD